MQAKWHTQKHDLLLKIQNTEECLENFSNFNDESSRLSEVIKLFTIEELAALDSQTLDLMQAFFGYGFCLRVSQHKLLRSNGCLKVLLAYLDNTSLLKFQAISREYYNVTLPRMIKSIKVDKKPVQRFLEFLEQNAKCLNSGHETLYQEFLAPQIRYVLEKLYKKVSEFEKRIDKPFIGSQMGYLRFGGKFDMHVHFYQHGIFVELLQYGRNKIMNRKVLAEFLIESDRANSIRIQAYDFEAKKFCGERFYDQNGQTISKGDWENLLRTG